MPSSQAKCNDFVNIEWRNPVRFEPMSPAVFYQLIFGTQFVFVVNYKISSWQIYVYVLGFVGEIAKGQSWREQMNSYEYYKLYVKSEVHVQRYWLFPGRYMLSKSVWYSSRVLLQLRILSTMVKEVLEVKKNQCAIARLKSRH